MIQGPDSTTVLHIRLLRYLFRKSRVRGRHPKEWHSLVGSVNPYDKLLLFVCAGLRFKGLDCRSGTGESFLMDTALRNSIARLF